MRFKTLVRCSASLAILAAAASPARAQDEVDTLPEDQVQGGEDAGTPQDETIVVTGLRRSRPGAGSRPAGFRHHL